MVHKVAKSLTPLKWLSIHVSLKLQVKEVEL